MAGWVRVASWNGVPKRGLVRVTANGEEICLVMTGKEDGVYALRDQCSHEDYPLSDGELLGDGRVECIYHGAKFDPASGRAVALPAIRPVKTYDVSIEGDDILVRLE
jgi:3-phenylpropionate/trans-cinnamate dioxygenase ferredoxin component